MPHVVSVTEHALDRFVARSRASDRMKAAETLLSFARAAMPLDRKSLKYHHNGWVMVIKNGSVLTAYRHESRSGWKRKVVDGRRCR